MEIKCQKCGHAEETDVDFFVKVIGSAMPIGGYWAWVTFLFAGTGFAMAIVIAIVTGGTAMLAYKDEIVEWIINQDYKCKKCGCAEWKASKSEPENRADSNNLVVEEKEIAKLQVDDLNTRINVDGMEVTPLFPFILIGEYEKTKLLIDKGADVNTQFIIKGKVVTPLFFSVFLGYHKISELLINKGANVNTQLSLGDKLITPLFYSILFSDHEASELLINNSADVNAEFDLEGKAVMPLLFSILLGEYKITKLLINKGADVKFQFKEKDSILTPLYFSIMLGEYETTKLLINKGADINSVVGAQDSDVTLLMLSILFGEHEISTLLLYKGAKTPEKFTLYTVCLLSANEKATEMILDVNILDVNKDTILTGFLKDFDIQEEQDEIMNMGSPVNAIQNNVHDINQNLTYIKSILPSVNNSLRNNKINTINLGSMFNRVIETINLKLPKLLHNISQKQIQLYEEMRPLKITKRFIDNGGDINLINNQNETALSIAYNSNLIEVVLLLIKNGANVNIMLENGRTLYEEVKSLNQDDLVKAIENSSTFVK